MKKLIDNFEEYLGALLFAIMFIVLVFQIIFRQILNSPLMWSEELSTTLFVFVAMLGVISAVKHNQHVAIDIIYNRFKGIPKHIIDLIIAMIIITVCICMMNIGYKVAINKSNLKLLTLGVSAGYMYMALPLGAALMLIRFIEYNYKKYIKKNV